MTHPWGGWRGEQRRQAEIGNAKHRQTRCRIPPGQLSLEDIPIVSPYAQPVVAADRAHRGQDDAIGMDEAARRSPAPLHLNDGGRDSIDSVGHLS